MGLKLIVIGGLALFMTIPALFVYALISDRTQRAEQVTKEIGQLVGGPQTFLGPLVAVPYALSPAETAPSRSVYLICPVRGDATVRTKTEERRRSLFRVPVYQSEIAFHASFDLAGSPHALPLGATLDWSRAEFVVGATDPRGALSDANITSNGKTATLAPATVLDALTIKGIGERENEAHTLTLFGAREMVTDAQPQRFEVTATLKFSGAQRLAILAYGKTSAVSMTGDWPHPSYDGSFLPVRRHQSGQGFEAQWSVPFIARGVRAEGRSDLMTGLGGTAMGVSFVELADPYQSVSRSLKYALLFLSIVFSAYFLFEVTTGKRVHPAQYVLVGVAQLIFYLLLLAIAERIGFDAGFAIAATATVVLLSLYAGWVFESVRYRIRALISFSCVYALIYILMRLEDQALLVGAVVSFATIAALMYFTRNIDWYGSLAGNGGPKANPDA
jgi:inner membrane protein